MKIIIAGSRDITDSNLVAKALYDSNLNPTEIVSGGARGVDSIGEMIAENLGVPCKRFPADWATHGNKAGYLRNEVMGSYADALVAIWDGKSKGTKHMIDVATKNGLVVFVKRTDEI